MSSKNLDWIMANVWIFIDQNISQSVVPMLKAKGYKKVDGVLSSGHVGANDGKLHKLLKQNKMVLITHDKHFHKQTLKYNQGMALLIKILSQGCNYSRLTICKKIQEFLLHNYKLLKSYYEPPTTFINTQPL